MATDFDFVTVSPSMWLRDESGQFLAALDSGASAAVMALADALAGLSIIFAPKKTGALAASIEPIRLAAHEGAAVARAGHAAPQEKGAGPHSIGAPGQRLVNVEDDFAAVGPVMHPGNPATRFMERAAAAVRPIALSIVKPFMPG